MLCFERFMEIIEEKGTIDLETVYYIIGMAVPMIAILGGLAGSNLTLYVGSAGAATLFLWDVYIQRRKKQ